MTDTISRSVICGVCKKVIRVVLIAKNGVVKRTMCKDCLDKSAEDKKTE